MADAAITTKQVYQAYLRGEVSLERVEESARETLAKYLGGSKPPEDARRPGA
jgi:hypothetical protein